MLLVSLLGAQAIIDEATGVVRSRSTRALALIAFLACHGDVPQSRQHIASLFWPESTDAQALTNLRRELHHLRQTLADDTSLVVTPTDLRWHDSDTCQVDVRAFRQQHASARAVSGTDDEAVLSHGRRALSSYGGELLPGMYDDWILDQREELQQECVRVCRLLVDAARRTGRYAMAMDAAKRRVRLQPLEEDGYRTLMELQAEQGDRAGAVSTYHRCASVLERELQVDPDPATAKLAERLFHGGQATPKPSTQPTVIARTGTDSPWVGRSTELATLEAVWRQTGRGSPAVALVTGDVGVGKTRLVTEFAQIARTEGAIAPIGRCFDTRGRVSLSVIADWLDDPAIGAATERLDPVWRAEVDRLAPTGTTPRPAGHASRVMVDAWQRRRFYEGLTRALLAAPQPVVLMLDNLQWCDEETLTFLTFLLGHSTGMPVMLALTLRDPHDNPSVVAWHQQLRGSGLLHELALSPLDVGEVADLAGAVFGRTLDRAEAALLHSTTGGFPLYVVEGARSVLDPAEVGAAALSDVLRRRLEQTTPEAREVAGLAAALGQDFALPVLTEACDLDTNTVVRAVDELWRQRIVRELPEGYDFSHDLLRDAAYAAISPARRWLLHRRLAQALELVYRGRTDEVAAQLAEQYARANEPDRAISYSRRAAEMAAAVFAHTEAIRYHRKALSLLGRSPRGRARDERELRCLEALAPSLNASEGYASPRLEQALEHTIDLAERLGSRDSMMTAMVGLWACRFVQGHTRAAHEIAVRMLDMVETGDPRIGQVHFSTAGSSLHLGRPGAALEHFDTALRSVGTESLTFGTRASVHAAAWSAHAAWLLGDYEEAERRAALAVDEARRAKHPYTLAVGLAYAAVTRQLLGDLSSLQRLIPELRSLCRRYDFAYYSEWVRVLDGWLLGGSAGTSLIRAGIDNLKAQHALARMPYWLSLLAAVAPEDQAVPVLDAALASAYVHDDQWYLPELMRRRAAFDPPAGTVGRLTAAAELAAEHESPVLAQRCERDLERLAHGVRDQAGASER